MDAKKLEILMDTVDLGSFSKASESVGYTQSGLTHLVDAIEKEIGIKLIARTNRGVSLTEEGKALTPYIREYISANAKLEGKIRSLSDKAGDVIRVAAYSSIAMHWMPEILYRFRRICPEVNVELRMVDHALEPFELLRNGKTDVVFASRQESSSDRWVPLYKEKMFVILPKSYPADSDKAFPISKLEGADFIMPYGKFDLEINKILQETGVSVSSSSPKVDDETVIRMVGAGLGITIMTELMIRGRTDDVKCIPILPTFTRELGMEVGLNADSEAISKLKKCVMEYVNEK